MGQIPAGAGLAPSRRCSWEEALKGRGLFVAALRGAQLLQVALPGASAVGGLTAIS